VAPSLISEAVPGPGGVRVSWSLCSPALPASPAVLCRACGARGPAARPHAPRTAWRPALVAVPGAAP